MSSEQASFRRVTSTISRIVESYCDNCGLFIGASPLQWVVTVVEKLHRCPPSHATGMTSEQLELMMKESSEKETKLLPGSNAQKGIGDGFEETR